MRIALQTALRSIVKSENGIEAGLLFSSESLIFKGHFPDIPVVPAVYQIGVYRMLTEENYDVTSMKIVRSRFLLPCLPDVLYKVKISVVVENDTIHAQGCIILADAVYSKASLSFERSKVHTIS